MFGNIKGAYLLHICHAFSTCNAQAGVRTRNEVNVMTSTSAATESRVTYSLLKYKIGDGIIFSGYETMCESPTRACNVIVI